MSVKIPRVDIFASKNLACTCICATTTSTQQQGEEENNGREGGEESSTLYGVTSANTP